jgi:hypothetical protein
MNGSNARVFQINLLRPVQRAWNFGASTFQRHPFLVKTISSGIGFAVGDGITQLGLRKKGDAFDWPRNGKMGGAGILAAGPLGYLFIVWMEAHIMPGAPTR